MFAWNIIEDCTLGSSVPSLTQMAFQNELCYSTAREAPVICTELGACGLTFRNAMPVKLTERVAAKVHTASYFLNNFNQSTIYTIRKHNSRFLEVALYKSC